MTRVLRVAGTVLLWTAAVIGVVSGLLWGANALGWVKPLVVVSGSMQPGIRTGDLLLSTPVAAADLEAGDVATLPSSLADRLVTHRIIAITRAGDAYEIRMQGDANDSPDAETYVVRDGERVWSPAVRLPGVGYAVAAVMRPGVAVPLVVSLAALIALAALPRRVGPADVAAAVSADEDGPEPATSPREGATA